MKINVVILCIIYTSSLPALHPLPKLSTPKSHVKVPLGGDVNLTCTVNNYSLDYTVMWLYEDEDNILTYQWTRVTTNTRFSITNPQSELWILTVQEVRLGDSGRYLCVINTKPTQKKTIFLDVKTYVRILENASSPATLSVEKGKSANLSCRASGNPIPTISWYYITDNNKTLIESGGDLILDEVNRSQEGKYLCVANNSISPPISKIITLKIKFSPLITILQRSVAIPADDVAYLNCYIECNPTCFAAWLKNNTLLPSNKKYVMYQQNHGYSIHTKLAVVNPEFDDFGKYECVAVNYLGSASELISIMPMEYEQRSGATRYFNWQLMVLLHVLLSLK